MRIPKSSQDVLRSLPADNPLDRPLEQMPEMSRNTGVAQHRRGRLVPLERALEVAGALRVPVWPSRLHGLASLPPPFADMS